MESELNSIISGIIADAALESGATVVSNPSSSDLALVDYGTYFGSIGDSYLQLLDEEDVNAEPELWLWKRPSFQRKMAAITGYVRMKDFADVRSQLKQNPEAYQKFKDSCFGRYLEYCKDKNTNCPNAVLHAMLGQQVKRVDVSEPDALWFRVSNKFLPFSKYEYALVTGLRFGPTDFDSNVKYEYPAGGEFKRRNGDETKMHWVFEAVPSLAEYLNFSENKSPKAQRPRSLKWPLPSYSKNVVEFFDNQTPVECKDELKPTVEEENAYPWLIYLSDDVQTHVKHIARGSVVSTHICSTTCSNRSYAGAVRRKPPITTA
ncbi:hypothetical protein CASFOL_042914 [Castilleja foliolosa]|uniref:Uncharacterized protein n=1 Tax=Castilleja foliolosa TaxID=1961234 RepID=A0ABD3B7A4_9LAMI